MAQPCATVTPFASRAPELSLTLRVKTGVRRPCRRTGVVHPVTGSGAVVLPADDRLRRNVTGNPALIAQCAVCV